MSFPTVSKVLNGRGTVSPETRKRILAAAEQLGYVPNVVARSLVKQSTCAVGVLISELRDYVQAQFVAGAEHEGQRQGHCIIVSSINQNGSNAGSHLQALVERRVDGILLAAPCVEQNTYLAEKLVHIPTVSTCPIPGSHISIVGSDHVQTGYLPTHHLLKHGHRCIGTITGFKNRLITQNRLRGYRQALEEATIPYDPHLVIEGDWEVEGGYKAANMLLERASDITAIFAHNDLMAIGVLSALHNRGLRAPEDCAVVSCDNLPIAVHTIPSLTSVHIPFYEIGETAMRLLLEQIKNPQGRPQSASLPVSLVQRSSSAFQKIAL